MLNPPYDHDPKPFPPGACFYRLVARRIARSRRRGTGRTAAALETITYETGPCFGVCPVYRVTLSPDGRGVFEGKRFTAATGKRAFRVDAKTFAEFSRRTRGVRPVGEVLLTGGALCQSMATDMATIDVRWTGGRRPAHLAYNLGCDRERYGWKANVFQKAITVLPVAKFIGPREGHMGR